MVATLIAVTSVILAIAALAAVGPRLLPGNASQVELHD
jgi:hypothetical protein